MHGVKHASGKGLACWLALGLYPLLLSACALFPDWHWAKPGASEADYDRDEIACKSLVYSSADGMVTQSQVRRMQLCLQSKGWQKVKD